MKSKNSALARAQKNKASGLLYLSHHEGFGQIALNHLDKCSDNCLQCCSTPLPFFIGSLQWTTNAYFDGHELRNE